MNKSNLVVGILHLNTKVSFESAKSFQKIFTPHHSYNLQKYFVKTKKEFQSCDMYAIVDINNGIASIFEYIGNIGDYYSEIKYIKALCCSHWTSNKKFNIDDYLVDMFESTRINFFDKNIYTIDPPDCTDIDDGLHITKIDDNTTEVGIHIADVSAFIPENSKLDSELQNRCESLYLKYDKVNMLPDKLVEIMSLKKDDNKCSFTLLIKFEKCEIMSYKFVHTKIKIKNNLTYEQADKQIKNKKNNDLCDLYNLGFSLHKKIFKDEKYDVHKMVAIFMIYANMIAAKNVNLLRSHNGPKRELYSNNRYSDCANLLLMKRAQYSLKNDDTCLKHYGLKLDEYTHFTSPIRRYADIIVHRMLNTKNNVKIDENTITKLNEKHKLYDDCEHRFDLINKIYEICENEGDVVNVTGHIVAIYENKIKMYIDDYDFYVDKILVPKQFQNLIKCNYSKGEDSIKVGNVTLCMFQKINIKMAIVLHKKNKLILQISELQEKCDSSDDEN
jgi:exoribonuclease R